MIRFLDRHIRKLLLRAAERVVGPLPEVHHGEYYDDWCDQVAKFIGDVDRLSESYIDRRYGGRINRPWPRDDEYLRFESKVNINAVRDAEQLWADRRERRANADSVMTFLEEEHRRKENQCGSGSE